MSDATTDLLLVAADRGETGEFLSLIENSFMVEICNDPESAVSIMRQKSIRLTVVLVYTFDRPVLKVLRILKNTYFQEPAQIIAGVDNTDYARRAIELGADDAFTYSDGGDDALLCIQAAAQRLKQQIRVHGNLAFFRKAARQEEELSAKILDRHMVLKEAFQSIESMNQELEETNRELEKIARYDTLSGLLNRASLFTALDTEIDRSLRTKVRLSGIMIDIDNFKSINDTYGHLYGDKVIAEVGRRLTNMLRRYDVAGRYGGEEFFIILPNTTLQQAYLIAERFRKRLSENPFDFSGEMVAVTASFGIAEYRETETREAWISRCDSQLYRAKTAGRNRVSG